MFDPTIGQFISEDPIGFDAGDPNLKRYVGNSPTNATDPSGLQQLDDLLKQLETKKKPEVQPLTGTLTFTSANGEFTHKGRLLSIDGDSVTLEGVRNPVKVEQLSKQDQELIDSLKQVPKNIRIDAA